MMNIVKNSANPIRIWFEGISCVPNACRKKWKTMTIRVKAVIVTSTAGINDRNVSRIRICSGADTVPTFGISSSSAGARSPSAWTSSRPGARRLLSDGR